MGQRHCTDPVHLALTIDHELQTYRRCLLFLFYFFDLSNRCMSYVPIACCFTFIFCLFLFSSLPTLPVFWHMRIRGLTVDVNADVRIIIIINQYLELQYPLLFSDDRLVRETLS